MKASLVLDDAVFARMMEIEVGQRHFAVSICSSLEEAVSDNPDYIFVSETLYDRHIHIPEICEIAIIGNGPSQAEYGYSYFERPVVITEMLDSVLGNIYSESGTGKKKKSVTDGLKLYSDSHCAAYRGERVSLSKKEFALLKILMDNKGTIVSRDEAASVFTTEKDSGSNIVDVYVKYLRQKIDEHFGIKLITSVRGKGYIIKP